MALVGLACGTAATDTPSAKSIPAPIAAPAPAATLAPAPTATPRPTLAQVVAEREVVLAAWRNLVNGERDPYYLHDILMVFESLVDLDNELRPFPQLAESWALSDDGLTWTFKLRQGISFTDGTPFDAEAMVANIQRLMKISPRPSFFAFNIKQSYGDLAGVSKVGDHTGAFQLNTPNPSMVFTMSNFFSAMFSPKSFAANGDFTGIPAATGPFKLVEWKKDQFALLERSEGYRGKKPYVRRIRVRVIPDSAARVSALLAKEIDGVIELGALAPAEAKSLEGRPGITVAADPTTQSLFLAFGTNRPPFDSVELRQAVALAVDRKTIVDKLVLGYGTPGKSLLSPFASQWLSPKGEPTYDATRARALARLVLGNTRVSASLIYRSGGDQAAPRKEIAELLQSVLAELGIDVQVTPLESAAEGARVASGDWNLRITQQAWANGDPDFVMTNFLASKGSFNAANKGGYSNAEVDTLVAAGKAERDPQKRFAIYERLQEIAVRDVPMMPLYHWYVPYAYRDSISGLRHSITYQPTLDEIRLVK
jgi:peptide/nickel transport system substrate-binding protein